MEFEVLWVNFIDRDIIWVASHDKVKMKEIMDVKNQAKQLDMFHCFI